MFLVCVGLGGSAPQGWTCGHVVHPFVLVEFYGRVEYATLVILEAPIPVLYELLVVASEHGLRPIHGEVRPDGDHWDLLLAW